MHFMLMLARCFFVSTEIFMWVSHARNTLIGPRTIILSRYQLCNASSGGNLAFDNLFDLPYILANKSYGQGSENYILNQVQLLSRSVDDTKSASDFQS